MGLLAQSCKLTARADADADSDGNTLSHALGACMFFLPDMIYELVGPVCDQCSHTCCDVEDHKGGLMIL